MDVRGMEIVRAESTAQTTTEDEEDEEQPPRVERPGTRGSIGLLDAASSGTQFDQPVCRRSGGFT
jgi:hypothetical protein